MSRYSYSLLAKVTDARWLSILISQYLHRTRQADILTYF